MTSDTWQQKKRRVYRVISAIIVQGDINFITLFNLRATNSALNHRIFLKVLVLVLMQPHLEARLQNQYNFQKYMKIFSDPCTI